MAQTALSKTRASAIRLLRKYQTATEDERTPILRQVANALVDARGEFERADGDPDWTGKSHAYRRWTRDLFAEAGLPTDVAKTVQSAVRYHVGVVLRDRLDDTTLEAYGLLAKSPRDRSADRRHVRTATINAIAARDVAGGGLMALTAAQGLLRNLDVDELASLDDTARGVVLAVLDEIEKRVRAIRRRMETRR